MQESRYYNYGNTAREMEPMRRRIDEPSRRRQNPERKRNPQVTPRVRKNIQREQVINGRYVAFVLAVAVIVGAAFVFYLSLEAQLASRSSNITSLQLEISDLSLENDAAMTAIEDSVDLDMIKLKAENLGMVYITSSRVKGYQSPTADYVIQYEEIPESGILPQSDSVTE